jgi:hypothetical protein
MAAKAALLSQIVRLTKSILLRPADPLKPASAQFIAGKHPPFVFPSGGIALSWWYSEDTFNAIGSVATLLIDSAVEFKDCDVETVSDVVLKTLQELCLHKDLFDGDAVFLARHEALFACHVAPVRHFSEQILQAMSANLRRCMGRRCTIYALPRFKVPSFVVPGRWIRLIAKTDQAAWQKLIDDGYQFNGWSPLRPALPGREDRTFSPPGVFECVLVAEENGTERGTRFNSVLKFRQLGALLYATACERAPHRLHKAMARPFEFCVQFPHNSYSEGNVTRRDCDPVMPYFVSDVLFVSEDVAAIAEWYARLDRCKDEHKRRIEKTAHFVNRGMNSDDIESYVNYFVALDALFGQRGSVEVSILAGVRALKLGASLTEKAPWLFDLRNEIVHGGSRYISEWPKYSRYTQHFRSTPMNDIRDLAHAALLRAPNLYSL